MLSLRSRYKILLIVIAAIIILGFAQTFFQIIPALTPYNDVGLLTRMSSLGIGSFGAVLLTMNALPLKLFQNKFIEYFIVVLLIISLAINQPAFKLIILPFCSFYLVLKAAKFDFTIKPLRNFFGNKWIIYIGRLSYGIYIFHVPIDYYFTIYIFNVFWSLINFDTLGNFSFFKNYIWFFKFPFSVLLSVLFAALSFKYIESPILKLKDKFFKY